MKLATIESLRDTIGVASTTEIDTAIAHALEDATEIVSDDIRQKEFERAEYADIFQCNPARYGSGFDLLLSNGFLPTDVAPVVTYSGVLSNLIDNPYDTLVENEHYLVDYAKGVLMFREHELARFFANSLRYVRVAYTAGFEAEVGDATVFDQTQVPVRLKRAAIARAHLLVVNKPVLQFEGTEKPEMDDLRQDYSRLVQRSIRYAPAATIAMRHELVT